MTLLTTTHDTVQSTEINPVAIDRVSVEQRLIELAAFLVDGPPANEVPLRLDPDGDPLWFLADRMVASRRLRRAA